MASAPAKQLSATSALLSGLRGSVEAIADTDILETYRRDQAAPGIVEAGMPAVVARPRSTAEVSVAVRAAAEHRVPIVPRGAGSGLSGGANAVAGCLILSLERMTDVVELDPDSLLARVQPGVINAALRETAAAHGLWYAPDPASHEFSTIGGNVATNAGGLCCVKYGVTRDSLLGVEVVLADGRVIRAGRRSRKGVTGYDLAGLFCGSEGTLGVIAEATVRLMPMPRPGGTLAASFPRLGSAAQATTQIVRNGRPSLLELIDRTTINAVEDFQPMELDREAEALLFARADGPAARADVEWMAECCQAAGADLVVTSDEEAEGRMLMAARRLAYPALERRGTALLDDVAVPIGRIPLLLEGIEGIAAEHEVTIATFGHAGDGNMHPTIVYDHRDPEQVRAARSAFYSILKLALRLDGTITGEHGVGTLKRELLAEELGDAHDVHRRIKTALDPMGLFNPGKGI